MPTICSKTDFWSWYGYVAPCFDLLQWQMLEIIIKPFHIQWRYSGKIEFKARIDMLHLIKTEPVSICSQKQKLLLVRDKLSPCQQLGFLSSKENVICNNFLHLTCIGGGVLWLSRHGCCVRWQTTHAMTDVLATGLCIVRVVYFEFLGVNRTSSIHVADVQGSQQYFQEHLWLGKDPGPL